MPEAEIGIMYPDVETVRSFRQSEVSTPPTITPFSVSMPLLEVEVPMASVEIRDMAQNQLVTCIEILSPINKREPGLSKYREKRRRLHEAGVHLLEIDLLRRGQRPFAHPRIPSTPYLISLTRTGSKFADIWAINLQDPLPVVSIPLRPPDSDVGLDLALAFTTIYERAAYGSVPQL
jgi:hypothetical protein